LIAKELSRFGVTYSLFDATRPETLRNALAPRTRAILVETISNPLVRVADIPGLDRIAHDAEALLCVDHTFAPLLCQPLALGADVVIHSITKLIGGHSDVTLGILAASNKLIERVAGVASTFGMPGHPFDCWLALRGLATLGIRSARACETALKLTERLADHPSVRAAHYPGLTSHPDHPSAARILRGGFGTMAAIDLGGRNEADKFIRKLQHIPFAPSFADVSTTLSHPATTSHRFLSPEEQTRQGISPGLVRLSYGLEDPEDLWEDLRQALQG
jgi:cystathionine beta-lyase/cystathionine gamma-synthase